MNPKKSALGRGIFALMPDLQPEPTDERYGNASSPALTQEITLASIETNPYQPRTHFDEEALQELVESIRQHGLVCPITIRELGGEQYQLIAGERRFIACQRLGWETIPAYIRTASAEQMLEFALIENIQRQDLNPMEVALGYQRLMDECSLTIEAVGEKVSKKRATVNNYLRLLKLPIEIQAGLRDNQLSMGHARALLGLNNREDQLELYREVLKHGLSVRQVEEMVRLQLEEQPSTNTPPNTSPPTWKVHLQEIQRNLSNKYSTKVNIVAKEDGKGELRLSFYSLEDFNRLLEELL
jgi:ParB family transcriptional regulator, chromosome partitioning protein